MLRKNAARRHFCNETEARLGVLTKSIQLKILESAVLCDCSHLTSRKLKDVQDRTMISSNDFRPGVTIVYNNGVWAVAEAMHVKPGKGSAFVRTKLKNVETGNVLEVTFRAGEKVPHAVVEKAEMQ